MTIRLTNLHEALANAASDDAERSKKVQIRARRTLYDACSVVCARHGTTVSAFLNACMEGLVRDYTEEAGDEVEGHIE